MQKQFPSGPRGGPPTLGPSLNLSTTPTNLLTNLSTNSTPSTSSKTEKTSPKRQGLQILFGENWEKWTYMQTHLSYVTPWHISVKMSQLVNHYYGKNGIKTVWDMFAGLGMDAINLSRFFSSIIVTEIDPKVFMCMQKNLETLPDIIPSTDIKLKHAEDLSIEAYNEDAIVKFRDKNFMKNINLVYFDPPWGNSFRTGEPFDFDDITITTTDELKESLEKSPRSPKTSDASEASEAYEPPEAYEAQIEINVMDLLTSLYDKVGNVVIKSPILSDSFERWAKRREVPILQICEFPAHKLKYLFLGPKSTTTSASTSAVSTASVKATSSAAAKVKAQQLAAFNRMNSLNNTNSKGKKAKR